MVLTLPEIKNIILNNPNKALVVQGQQLNKDLRFHIYGAMKDTSVVKIEGFEGDMIKTLRVKYARSNKDVMSRLARPVDKVFSARGGSIYYNMSEDRNKRAIVATSDTRDGMGTKEWIENYWKPHFLDDPNGVLFMEIGNGSSYPVGKVYPTYKPITDVYDYKPKGSSLDYIVFTVKESEKKAAGIITEGLVYRVVDDAFDYWVKLESQEITIIREQTFPNYFMSVPAMINSDIVNSEKDCGVISIFNEALELANEFFLKGSIKITHDFLHAFPKYWEYADTCNKCGGAMVFDGNVCPDCKGSGKSFTSKVSQVKLLNYPEGNDPIIAPNVAGYVSPDKTYYEIATSDLKMLEDLMYFTLWGTQSQGQVQPLQTTANNGQPKTATEVVDSKDPLIARLTPISKQAEKRAKFIIDSIVRVQLGNLAYTGASVNFGRRYMIEGPDALWTRYADAKAKGTSVSILDDMLKEWVETKYNGDPVGSAIQIKLLAVEPFIHNTINEVKGFSIAPEDYAAKVYFSEWLNTINDAYILTTDENTLRADLATYAGTKSMPEPQLILN